MDKYGINNVRGGTFCKLKLNDYNLITINNMINSANDKCYICGDVGHFANKCKQDNDSILLNLKIYNDLCSRCYRKGHYSDTCFAKTTINGEHIIGSEVYYSSEESDYESNISVYCCSNCDKEFDTLREATYHTNFYCKNT
jgi:hypothetical protein